MKYLSKIKKSDKRWLATFADLITLLLTFFVILLAMAQIDLAKFQAAIKSIRKDRGISPKLPALNDADMSDSFSSDSKVSAAEKGYDFAKLIFDKEDNKELKVNIEKELIDMRKKLEEVITENKLEGDVVLEMSNSGIRLRVKGKLLFDSGRADIKKDANRFIYGISDALKRNKFFLLVEGHTDSIPITTAQFPSNWELSAARAARVIRHIIDSGIQSERLSAIGYADNYPLASNIYLAGRSLNRRVEFIFTKYPTRVVI